MPALCYIVDRGHPQYAGQLSLDDQLHHVRQGHGMSGANRDYVIATVAALEQLGYRDAQLHRLAQLLGSQGQPSGSHPHASAMAHAGDG
jgi:cation transport protein ChaC